MARDVSNTATSGMHENYNEYSQYQWKAIELSKPFIRQAIDALQIDHPLTLLMLADFGSAQGANSVQVAQYMIDCLKDCHKFFEPVCVVHNDLPSNTWSTVFDVLNRCKSYQGVVCGRSFYEQCLPRKSLLIAHSSTSIHWLSEKPCNFTDHCYILHCTKAEEQESFRKQAYIDYMQFLQHRSNELLPGGVLILTNVCMKDEQVTGFDLLYRCAKRFKFTEQDLYEFTLPMYHRSREEFIDNELFARFSFELIAEDFLKVESPFIEQWEKNEISLEEFARLNTGFIRMVSESILRQTLMKNGRTKDEVEDLLHEFWAFYEQELQKSPEYNDSYLNFSFLVLRKQTANV